MKRRIVTRVPCADCLTTGIQYYDGKWGKCIECNGTGYVERVINDLTPEPEKA